jgi:hypothetical protein
MTLINAILLDAISKFPVELIVSVILAELIYKILDAWRSFMKTINNRYDDIGAIEILFHYELFA